MLTSERRLGAPRSGRRLGRLGGDGLEEGVQCRRWTASRRRPTSRRIGGDWRLGGGGDFFFWSGCGFCVRRNEGRRRGRENADFRVWWEIPVDFFWLKYLIGAHLLSGPTEISNHAVSVPEIIMLYKYCEIRACFKLSINSVLCMWKNGDYTTIKDEFLSVEVTFLRLSLSTKIIQIGFHLSI